MVSWERSKETTWWRLPCNNRVVKRTKNQDAKNQRKNTKENQVSKKKYKKIKIQMASEIRRPFGFFYLEFI